MEKKLKNKIIETKNLSVNYAGVKALSDVSAYFKEESIIGIIGTNGSGKSTLLKSIFGFTPIVEGEILKDGKKYDLSPHKLVESKISFVPQGRQIFSSMSVEENIEMGAVSIKNKKEYQENLTEVYKIFPFLEKNKDKISAELSGGQQQQLAIARGLIIKPRLLLLDEPTIGLSPDIVKDVFKKIKEINQKQKTTIVIVEHNLKTLFEITKHIFLMDKGILVAEGSPKEIKDSGILDKIFLAN